MRHAMSQPIGTYAFIAKKSAALSMFQSKAIVRSTDITAATHIGLPPKTVSALRRMIYESPLSVWESQLSFTGHLKSMDVPVTLHGALYRLMGVKPEERLNCRDLVDIDLMLDRHLSLFVAAAPKGRERHAYDALRSSLNANHLKPTVCAFVNSAASEYLDLDKYYEAQDEIGSFEQFRDSNIPFIMAAVSDCAPPQCAYRFELWVASESGAKSC